MWVCSFCDYQNYDISRTTCENCGQPKGDDSGDSMDNKDSEELFFDDEGI
jgi:hypothetical protein